MATLNLTWTPCGSSSDGTYIYFGKTNVVTGTPISGTGWTLYTGSALANGASSATISSLDDNVQYTAYAYCHCPAAGNGPLVQAGPVINYACPTLTNIVPSYNGVSYTLSVPGSANNAGSYITKILVQLYDSTNTTLLQANTYNSPFTAGVNDSFSALSSATNYNLRVVYSNTSGSLTNNCVNAPVTTSTACGAPTVTLTNPSASGFQVGWTPSTGGTFDVLINGNVVATGLTTGPYTATGLNPATAYQVNVRLNCTTGGNGISTTQSITTNNAAVTGQVAINQNLPSSSGSRKTLSMAFTFAQPTAFPMTVYFGESDFIVQNGGTNCSTFAGYDIYTPPMFNGQPGYSNAPLCPFGNQNLGFAPSGNLPWVINIPQGVTTYNTPVDSVYTTAGPGSNVGSSNPGGFQYAPWSMAINSNNRSVINIWMRVTSPSGYSANFTLASGQNVPSTQVGLTNV